MDCINNAEGLIIWPPDSASLLSTLHWGQGWDCTDLNNYVLSTKRGYFWVCQKAFKHYGFVQGVDGHLTEVDFAQVHSCTQGDNNLWVQVQLCCPGN